MYDHELRKAFNLQDIVVKNAIKTRNNLLELLQKTCTHENVLEYNREIRVCTDCGLHDARGYTSECALGCCIIEADYEVLVGDHRGLPTKDRKYFNSYIKYIYKLK